MSGALASVILLVQFSLILGTFKRDEWPVAHLPVEFRSNCLTYDVRIYGYDFGFDQHVTNLSPGQTYSFLSHLGQKFFALSPQNIFLGNFTVHWDSERAPARAGGSSQRFILQCPDDYLYLCPACNRGMELILTITSYCYRFSSYS
jgi:hypothetical protein